MINKTYRGRIAPSPTGYLHVGHALTFWCAQERARAAGGELVLRMEDLDSGRCRPEFRAAVMEDLHWFGLRWSEGPDIGGPCGRYAQSERREFYIDALNKLHAAGLIYPCHCSRKDIAGAALAPHDENEEPIYPGTCRPAVAKPASVALVDLIDQRLNWRFRVPDGERLEFNDLRRGRQLAVVGRDFGDFIVWRRDDVPAYQLAVVVDDAAMRIGEVVRGEDLLTSTFRQLLIYRALGLEPPTFYHAPLITDEHGIRLAKRNASLSLRALRESGRTPEQIRARNR
jgi:glutamyl/glutaminyl-tRNA synthetase